MSADFYNPVNQVFLFVYLRWCSWTDQTLGLSYEPPRRSDRKNIYADQQYVGTWPFWKREGENIERKSDEK